MLITPNPDTMSEKHAMRRNHSVQSKQVGPAKMAHCLDCGGQWFNMDAAAEATVNDMFEDALKDLGLE